MPKNDVFNQALAKNSATKVKRVVEQSEISAEKEAGYWKRAARNFKSSKMLAFAALICALRIVVKLFSIQLAPGLRLTFDCYVNAIGSLIYGPLVGLGVGALSDSIGYLVNPSGAYFPPFMLVEMLSSFIFGLFFWGRKITATKAVVAKFTVNLVCNIIFTSLFTKWMAELGMMGTEYYFFDAARIVKNLVLFPLEGTLICFILNAFMPALKRMRIVSSDETKIPFRKKDVILLIVLFALSVALVLFYVFFFKDFLKANNIRFW